MKEAAGEANITVITIVLIAVVLAVGTVVVNNVLRRTAVSSACTNAGKYWHSGSCCSTEKCAGTGNRVYNCRKAESDTYLESHGIAKGEWYCETWN